MCKLFKPSEAETAFEGYLGDKYLLISRAKVAAAAVLFLGVTGFAVYGVVKSVINGTAAQIAEREIAGLLATAHTSASEIDRLRLAMRDDQRRMVSVNLRVHHNLEGRSDFVPTADGQGYQAWRTITIEPPFKEPPLSHVALADVLMAGLEPTVSIESCERGKVVVLFQTGKLPLSEFCRMDAAVLLLPIPGVTAKLRSDGSGDQQVDLFDGDNRPVHTITVR